MSGSEGASTFIKGLHVLACFEAGKNLTMADVARASGFDRATARRLCLALVESGYLRKDGKFLNLSAKAVAIAGGYSTANDIGKSVQPILNQVAEEITGEVSIAVRDGDRAIFIARSAVSGTRLSFGFSVGSTLPLFPTAIGRMLLAISPNADRQHILDTAKMLKFTAATDINRHSLSEKIDAVAAQGYASARDEFELGATGLAVPIAPIGGAETVLGTTASTSRFDQTGELERNLDALQRAAMILRR